MSRRTDEGGRRKLGLKRETVRQLSARDLGQVAGGSWMLTGYCGDTSTCDRTIAETDACSDSGYSTGSRYC